uniref:Uncharacterized protein n=1 Tax=Acanthochromis polyacanthus TaxID=80966 RepID=A0A3Q1GDH0_9TELE
MSYFKKSYKPFFTCSFGRFVPSLFIVPSLSGRLAPSRCDHQPIRITVKRQMPEANWHEGPQESLNAVYSKCHGNHVRGVCVYGVGDLQGIIAQHHLFANKFDINTDPIAIYCLEKYLRQKALAELY